MYGAAEMGGRGERGRDGLKISLNILKKTSVILMENIKEIN